MNKNRLWPRWVSQSTGQLFVRTAVPVCIAIIMLIPAFAHSQCKVKCVSKVNISLDQSCEATITPGSVGASSDAPMPDLGIVVSDANNIPIPGNKVDLTHVNQTLEFTVIDASCGNSCWGTITVEYKLGPKIQCPKNDTLPCGAIDDLPLPTASAQCGQTSFNVFLLNETKVSLNCDPDYTHVVTRTYRAVADVGVPVDCQQTIHVERIEIDSVKFPQNICVSCADPNLYFNGQGFPYPWVSNNPLTGSGSVGVPYICTPQTGSGSAGFIHPLCGPGNLLVPLVPNIDTTTIVDSLGNIVFVESTDGIFCNSAITYTDVVIPSGSCERKLVRTWEVREWWCSGEEIRMGFHTIEVKDSIPPVFNCPSDFTISSLEDCSVEVDFPAITATDQCGNGVIVNIDPEGSPFLYSNGGLGTLNAGINKVTYIVNDSCYNEARCDMFITVRDDVEPVAICEQEMVVSISSGITYLKATSLDDGSWDGCGIDSLRVRRMTTDCDPTDLIFGEHVEICCTDAETEVMVVFRAYDTGGNFNDCMVRVAVQDKAPVSLECPDRDTIDCRTPYDLNNLSATFGEAKIIDLCTGKDTLIESYTDDINQCGKGKITRNFVLRSPTGDSLTGCQQVVCIVDSMLFSGAMIVWPSDTLFTSGACDLADLDPSDFLPVHSEPRFSSGDDECSLLGYSYTDNVITGSASGTCYVIERTWTVINWCDESTGTFARFTDPNGPQVITVTGNTAPSITDLSPIQYSSANVDCETGLLDISQSASDDCNVNNLSWTYVLLDMNADTVTFGNSNSFNRSLVVGDYLVHWRVSDRCGNTTFGEQMVTIINRKAPSPVCLTNQVFALNTANDELELWASDFDGGSSQNCDNPFAVSIGPNTANTNITYDCDSVGMREVRLYVTDLVTGNSDFCIANLTITDEGSCPTNSPMIEITGLITNEHLTEIENVEIYLGNTSEMAMTDDQGEYAFPEMPMGGSYVVTPAKDNDHLNGVSTLDLVLIQKHVLGQETLESPYDMIASDVNNDKEITSIDIIELRKLILGIYDELPDNTSWRFIDKDHQFIDNYNPWMVELPEDYDIYQLNSDMHIDFIGVKVGDVNGSVVTNLNDEAIDQRQSRWPLIFTMEEMNLSDGIEYSIPVRAENYERVTGWQGTLEFNQELVHVKALRANNADLDDSNYFIDQENGSLTFSYDSNNQDLESDDILFEIVLEVSDAVDISEVLSLSSDRTRSEAYRGKSEVVNLELHFNTMQPLEIISANPNPWSVRTNVQFTLSKSDNVAWEVYDVNGRVVYRNSGYFSAGNNTIDVKQEDLEGSGIYYIRLISSENTDDYKMVLLR